MKLRARGVWAHLRDFIVSHKRQCLIGVGVFIGSLIVVQLLYPSNRLLPFAKVEGVEVGVWQKKDAAWELDTRYKTQDISLYFGKTDTPQVTAKPADIGLVVANQERFEELRYPWYMRLLPSSLFWYGLVQVAGDPNYQRNEQTLGAYMKDTLGESCRVDPVDATLKVESDKLVVVPSANGGTCELSEVQQELQSLAPRLTNPTRVTIAMDEIAPDVNDDDARELAETINARLSTVTIQAGEEVEVPASELVSWLTFATKDKRLVVVVDDAKAKKFLDTSVAPKVAVAAGVTKVTTRDFLEVSRVNGANGRALDHSGTGESVVRYLTKQADDVRAVTRVVAPRVDYTRSYSPTDTGLSALIKHYAEGHSGVFGVQLIELSGDRRRAGFNESKQFTAASTYKLFVAYGTLKKVESGAWKWSDQVAGGRDMAACFDDMIVKSDNPCAETLLERYGYSNLTRDIRALGLSNASGFIGDGPKATAGDLALFMAMLETKQLPLKAASRDRLVSALKRNVYRQGIPAGASGSVADKVGFLNGLLHDAAIVYSPRGTYVLVVMTDKSSWATIADLTKKIEALRTQ